MARKTRRVPLVSVLVPFYNDESYLPKCLDSLLSQTLQNIEIICINDGSSDQSLDIVKDYSFRDDRIIVIDKQNTGYGDSLNQGLAKARGKYIGIIEADDWIESYALKKMYYMGEENNAEIVRANYYEHKTNYDNKIDDISLPYSNRILDPNHHTWLYLIEANAWPGIYQKNFLTKNNIQFLPTPGASYQDTSFVFKTWSTAKAVYLTNEAFLHHRIDETTYYMKNLSSVSFLTEEYDEVERYLKDNNNYDNLVTTLWIAKTLTYFKKATQLNPKFLEQFMQKIAPEIIKASHENIPFADYYTFGNMKSFLHAILNDNLFQAKHVVQRSRKKALRLQKTNFKFHPYRTKAYTINHLLADLNTQNEFLQQSLRDLNQQQEQSHDQKSN